MSVHKLGVSPYSSPSNDPCMKERKLSMKCLEENNYNHESCTLYFDNYNNCNRFWNEVQSARKRKGIQPSLPEPEERDKIKEEYLKTMNK